MAYPSVRTTTVRVLARLSLRRSIIVAGLLLSAVLVAGGVHYGLGARTVHGQSNRQSQAGPQTYMEQSFAATGLPAGEVTGLARHQTWPSGFTSKHSHGGPTYIYVISGDLEISDADGTKNYGAGDFFWEMPGHVHTGHTNGGAEFFVLFLLPPGSDPTIPAQ